MRGIHTVGLTLGLAAVLAWAPGCSGGGGGPGTALGPDLFGVPFVPTAASGSTMTVGFRNLDSDSSTVVTVQGYKPDGTPYTGPVLVPLSGLGETRMPVSTALGGDAPEGGWISVATPSRLVEVYASVEVAGKAAAESMRAAGFPFPVPAAMTQGVTVTPQTDTIQISNATAAPLLVTVTAYSEPAGDPLLPPTVSTPPAVALAAYETKTYSPDSLSGISGFSGAFQLSAPGAFLAAAVEDLAFEVSRSQVLIEARVAEVSVSFGREIGVGFENVYDFAMVVRNDADQNRTVTVTTVNLPDGTPLFQTPQTFSLAPFESRIVTTLDPPFDTVFGDAEFATKQDFRLQLSLPDKVETTFRQFDPVALGFNMTIRPSVTTHGFIVMDVVPEPTTTGGVRSILSLLNPSTAASTARIEALIPEPAGFDGSPIPLANVVIPARGLLQWSPDGATFLNRDGDPVDAIGLRVISNVPVLGTMFRRKKDPTNLVVFVTPSIVRSLEDSDD